MKSVTLFLLATVCMLMFGCAGAMEQKKREMVAGLTGCPPNTITFADESSAFAYGGSFTAKCQGRTFYCQWTGEYDKSCKETIGSKKGSSAIKTDATTTTQDTTTPKKKKKKKKVQKTEE